MTEKFFHAWSAYVDIEWIIFFSSKVWSESIFPPFDDIKMGTFFQLKSNFVIKKKKRREKLNSIREKIILLSKN